MMLAKVKEQDRIMLAKIESLHPGKEKDAVIDGYKARGSYVMEDAAR